MADDFVAGGFVLLGGAITALFGWAQSNVQASRDAKRYEQEHKHRLELASIEHERQRKLAADENHRKITAEFNIKLSDKLDQHLAYGQLLSSVLGQYARKTKGVTNDERIQELADAAELRLQTLRDGAFLTTELFEDAELQKLLAEFASKCRDRESPIYLAEVPNDDLWSLQETRRMRTLWTGIDLRRRQLMRDGKPL